jgi:hypothetical protein
MGSLGFDLEKVCTEVEGAFEVVGVHGVSQHDDDEVGEERLGPEPFEDFEPIHERHPEVEKEEVGQREFPAVAESGASLEIVNNFEAVGDFCDRFETGRMTHGGAKEEPVVLGIIRDQNMINIFDGSIHNRLSVMWRSPGFPTPAGFMSPATLHTG